MRVFGGAGGHLEVQEGIWKCRRVYRGAGGVSLFTGLDYWTGVLDSQFNHKISFPAQLQPLQCPSLGHQDIYLVQCNQSIVATSWYQTNCRGALGG